MGLIKRKEPWPRYFVKAALVLAGLCLIGVGFSARFTIGVDSQVHKCIPGTRFYLVDHWDTEVKKGKTFVFISEPHQSPKGAGQYIIKYVRGIYGDEVEIKNDRIFVNNQAMGYGLKYAEEKLGRPSSDFWGKMTLQPGQLWMMGTSPLSYDSRYWGALREEQIVARAYPLF